MCCRTEGEQKSSMCPSQYLPKQTENENYLEQTEKGTSFKKGAVKRNIKILTTIVVNSIS